MFAYSPFAFNGIKLSSWKKTQNNKNYRLAQETAIKPVNAITSPLFMCNFK